MSQTTIQVLETEGAVEIQNKGPSPVYIGPANQATTSQNGMRIDPGQILAMPVKYLSHEPMWQTWSFDMMEVSLVKKILRATKEELALYATSPDKIERELAELVLKRIVE